MGPGYDFLRIPNSGLIAAPGVTTVTQFAAQPCKYVTFCTVSNTGTILIGANGQTGGTILATTDRWRIATSDMSNLQYTFSNGADTLYWLTEG